MISLATLAPPSPLSTRLVLDRSIEAPSVPLLIPEPAAAPTPSASVVVTTKPHNNTALEAMMFGVGMVGLAPVFGDFAGHRAQRVSDGLAIYARALTLTGAALAIAQRIAPDELPVPPQYLIAALTAIVMGVGYQSGLDWLAFGADAVLGGVVAAGVLVAGEYHVGETLRECTAELAHCLKTKPQPPFDVRFGSAGTNGGGMLSVRMTL